MPARKRVHPDDNPNPAVQTFRDVGFGKRDILDITFGHCPKVMSNYTSHFANALVDEPLQGCCWQKAA